MKDIANYWFYDDKLSSSGMPTAEQMKEVADANVDIVINLAMKTSPGAFENEDQLVESLGMKYVHIPVEWTNPTRQNLEDFFKAMDEHRNDKVFVHCQANYRASAFIMLYRVLRLGWNKEDAIPVMERMWNPEDFPVWQKFIDENLANR
ncbi:MAG TPA: protein tyrosine phosphatase family protein [Anaerolineales bacterium]|nr:protein tyrosine phosphatase family protein [Anaerolineales bacterium]